MSIDKQGYFCYIRFMRYSLHHTKEALMLSTDDRQQVLAWSEQQPGKQASMALIIESDFDDIESLVERSGTGIRAEEEIGSRPPFGSLACFAQCRFGLVWQNVHSLEHCQNCQPGARIPTWH